MSGGELLIQLDGLDAAIARLTTATRAIQATLSTLEGKAQTLASQWTGEAADAYATAQASWRADLADLTDVLDAAIEAMTASRADYAEAEKANADRWRG